MCYAIVHVRDAAYGDAASTHSGQEAPTRGCTRWPRRRGQRPCSCAVARTLPAAGTALSAPCRSVPSPPAAAPATATPYTLPTTLGRRHPPPCEGPALGPRPRPAPAATCCGGAAVVASLEAPGPCAAALPPLVSLAFLAGLYHVSCAVQQRTAAAADAGGGCTPASAARRHWPRAAAVG